jgi:hypothetical protein
MTDHSNYEACRSVIQTMTTENVELAKNICSYLNHSERTDEVIAMFVYDHKWKKRKDANAPPKPRSSYLHWTESVRPVLREQHPDLDMPGMSKKMGELWQKLTSEDKQPFVEKADHDKIRYAQEKEAYDSKVCSQSAFLQGSGSQNASVSKAPPVDAPVDTPVVASE